jgi:hypothetical protein
MEMTLSDFMKQNKDGITIVPAVEVVALTDCTKPRHDGMLITSACSRSPSLAV